MSTALRPTGSASSPRLAPEQSARSRTAGSLTSDMVLVHKVFRRELRLLGALIADVTTGNVARATLLGSHYRELAKALVHHHAAERDLLWRRLQERAPLHPDMERRMLDWHRQHTELMSELDSLMPLWEQDADAEIRAVLADIVDELATSVTDHLDAVEQHVLPMVDRHVTPGEWLGMGLRAASWIPLNRMAWLLGAMLEDATPDERTNLMAKVPGPARLLYRMVGRDQYVREMQALRGSLTPSSTRP
ncbi:hemerythrin domain-containing protein [Nakamurella sp. GG22]